MILRRLVAILFVGLALAAEGTALRWALDPAVTAHALLPPGLLGLHVFSAVSAAEAFALLVSPAPTQHVSWRSGLVLGLLVPGGALLLVPMLFRAPRLTADVAPEDLSPMEARKLQAEAQADAGLAKETAGVNVETIGDALRDKDHKRRLGAVRALRDLDEKAAVQLLLQSVKNTAFEVRFSAVDALAKMNKKYADRIAAGIDALDADPSTANHRALAETYHEYASLEMEEESIQLHLYRRALAHFEQSRADEKTDTRLDSKIAQCLHQIGEHDRAKAVLTTILRKEPRQVQALLGLAQIHYAQGRFADLREVCQILLKLPEHEIADHKSLLSQWATLRPRQGA